ncbi:mitochondrial carrier [Acaromyces ingoldii]|uniref:Mitochondrial carrier n=1 Tax=Acaromyces ingoldii TaxID=215250 RepID=A0A316YT95_9BASI|nr:mitochondrial carrier [Acaromyces ingoldii]PWN91243.1 mitochondrial carrier [Acaromyces ingoldii]
MASVQRAQTGANAGTTGPGLKGPETQVAAPAPPVKISTLEGFAVGSCAASSAVLFSNPAEAVKTRMQLQGELLESGASKQRLYKNAWDCLRKTARTEGVAGVQRGLGAALVYQVCLNGSRLGFYEPFRRAFSRLAGRDVKEVWAPGALAAGASSGVVGAILGNPLFLVKARQQAYSPHFTIGKTSYHYKNALDGLVSIVRTDGVRGLARGMDAAILRTAMGSTVQLPAYNWFKTYLVGLTPDNNALGTYNPFLLLAGKPNSFWTYLASSTFSGLCVCAVMQPADTALSRVYNQPTMIDARGKSVGTLYRGPLHCLYLTAKTEGPLAWYKGTTAHLARIAPHTVLTLVLNEAYLRYYSNWKAGRRIFSDPVEKVV